jgi:hypothetical protein
LRPYPRVVGQRHGEVTVRLDSDTYQPSCQDLIKESDTSSLYVCRTSPKNTIRRLSPHTGHSPLTAKILPASQRITFVRGLIIGVLSRHVIKSAVLVRCMHTTGGNPTRVPHNHRTARCQADSDSPGSRGAPTVTVTPYFRWPSWQGIA